MKYLFLPVLLFTCLTAFSQAEPEMETSYDNMELLWLALAGLGILIALYFIFRRRKNK
jgi:LPXTG-motif cell wall-anchored protein